MTNSTVLGIPYLASQQATPEIPHNQALYMIEAMLRGVKAIQNAPPGGPADGDTYIVGTAGSGAWLGKNNCVAIYMSNAWRFIPGFNTLGAQIAMGAAQEGMSLWNIALDARYTWTGAAWSVASGVAASGVSNTPAGNISATDVQGAINELDTEKAGLALANPFTAVQTITLSAFDYNLQLVSTDAGIVGPYAQIYHNSASPAVSDFLGGVEFFGKDAGATKRSYAEMGAVIDATTAGAWSGRYYVNTKRAGVNTSEFIVGGGIVAGVGVTGGVQGVNTLNASNLFVGGVNINLIYAGLSANNALTGQNSITRGATTGLSIVQTTTGNDYNIAPLVIESQDAGSQGAVQYFYHNSASPAVNDLTMGLFSTAKTSTAAIWYPGGFSFITTNVTNGAQAARMNISTTIAGAFASRVSVGAGLFSNNATSGDQGADTSNFSSYYANGNLAIDTSALLRPRAFTVGTLPSASGIAGAMARVSDASAAPVYNAIAAGGGSTNAHVMSDGTNWRYC